MTSPHACVNDSSARKNVLPCRFEGRIFIAKQSQSKKVRYIFGYTDPRNGQHVRVKCSGMVEFRRCLTSLYRGDLLPLQVGGVA